MINEDELKKILTTLLLRTDINAEGLIEHSHDKEGNAITKTGVLEGKRTFPILDLEDLEKVFKK